MCQPHVDTDGGSTIATTPIERVVEPCPIPSAPMEPAFDNMGHGPRLMGDVNCTNRAVVNGYEQSHPSAPEMERPPPFAPPPGYDPPPYNEVEKM